MKKTMEKNLLEGKKWTICGDSFSAGDFTGSATDDVRLKAGRYAGEYAVYGYRIGERNDMDIRMLAVNGMTLAKPIGDTKGNTFLDTYQKIDLDSDYITLYFGINDSHHRPHATGDDGEDMTGIITLGDPDCMDPHTFYGAWNIVLPYLIEHYPFAHIGMLVSNGCETDEYRLASIEMAVKYGIPYIDLNGDQRTPMMLRSTNPNVSDSIKQKVFRAQAVNPGVNGHPNTKAHEYESTFIETFLRSI